MGVQTKICGLSDLASLDAAVSGGAAFVGFVFFPPSPRSILPERAADLVRHVPDHVQSVGLFVNPDDDLIDRVLTHAPLDLIQLHGAESPGRAMDVKSKFGKGVIKALPIRDADDFDAADQYIDCVDYLMFDAKAPKGANRPGGNAVAFDWHLMQGRSWSKPWFLAGGLREENVATAVRMTGASLIDISSGVEIAPGQKNPSKIKSFLRTASKL